MNMIRSDKKILTPKMKLHQLHLEELKDFELSGYLTKQGAVRKSWKKRFFVLGTNNALYYFNSDNVSVEIPSFSISC